MKNLYLKFDLWFKSRVQRERWLLSIVLIAVLGWLCWLYLVEPARLSYQQLTTTLIELKKDNEKLSSEVENIALRLNQDPNEALRERYQRSVELREQLGSLLDQKADFTQPEQLLGWIQALLAPGSGLTLEEFSTSPPKPFLDDTVDLGAMRVIQHPVKVTLTGDFFSINEYLDALAALPLAFYWQGLEYQVVEHPNALITLELFTLSYSAGNDET